ncbi:hypothetical protein ABQE69_11330 [Mycolicibacillus trivialis]
MTADRGPQNSFPGPEDADVMARPELVELSDAATERVVAHLEASGLRCECCGAADFTIGSALPMGFLFLDEDDDAYLVALTCRNGDCGRPRTGLRLAGADFLAATDS